MGGWSIHGKTTVTLFVTVVYMNGKHRIRNWRHSSLWEAEWHKRQKRWDTCQQTITHLWRASLLQIPFKQKKLINKWICPEENRQHSPDMSQDQCGKTSCQNGELWDIYRREIKCGLTTMTYKKHSASQAVRVKKLLYGLPVRIKKVLVKALDQLGTFKGGGKCLVGLCTTIATQCWP